jgi:hypothetical protein
VCRFKRIRDFLVNGGLHGMGVVHVLWLRSKKITIFK